MINSKNRHKASFYPSNHTAKIKFFFPSLLLICAIIFLLVTVPQAALAQSSIVQTFYVPLQEENIRTWALAIDPSLTPGAADTIRSAISITATFNGTIIYYDHWEDGFEDDIESPLQSTTRIFGNNNPADGIPPGFATDVINAGDVISLLNNVPANPRDQGNIFYDGRDKIGTTELLVVTRYGWPSTYPDAMLGGAVEVFDTSKWGTSYEMPLGENIPQAAFEYIAIAIMAEEDDTLVEVDVNADGTPDVTQTLDQGESLYVGNTGLPRDVMVGATVTASAQVQVDLLTANENTTWEGRWFSMVPRDDWGDTYYTPVGTRTGALTHVDLYNPNAAPITVRATQLSGFADVVVPAGQIFEVQMNLNEGGMFSTTPHGGEDFFAVSTIDRNGTVYDWGFTLIPLNSLTPMVVAGWAPGSTDLVQNVSPIWVTTVANTNLYVDLDGNPATGSLTDPYGNRYDRLIPVNALQSTLIYDDNPPGDNDQTRMRVYTIDGTRIAAAWGQDPVRGSSGQPTQLDMGTTVLPFSSLNARKSSSLYGDFNQNGGLDPGDILLYTITIHNSGIIPITDIHIVDTPDPDTTYVANTTEKDGTAILDNPLPATRFPLDEGGYDIVVAPAELAAGADIIVTFQATLNDPFPGGKFLVINEVVISTTSEIFVDSDSSPVRRGVLGIQKTSEIGGSPITYVNPGDIIDYTITVTNSSDTPQTGIELSDPLPAGTSYVANSTVATGPRQKFVKDVFNQLLYSNNDGPENWKADWVETDAAGGFQDPLAGNVQVINGELRLRANGSDVARSVDLTEFTPLGGFATLRFEFRTGIGVDATDAVVIEASNIAGGPFTVLETFTGITGASSGSRIYDISSYISADTTIRFRIPGTGGYTGTDEYFYVDKVEVRAVGASMTANDDFSSGNYSGGSGWAGNWIEDDPDDPSSQSPTTGEVRVVAGELRLDNQGVFTTLPSVSRAVDLSGNVLAMLSFDFRLGAGVDLADAAEVEVSRDGVYFTSLETFTNIPASSSGSRTYDITNYISATTTIRFRISTGYGGANEFFYADNVQITAGSQLSVTKDNMPAGANPDLIDGDPPDLVLPGDGFALAPGEILTVTFQVQADDPLDVTRIVNSATTTSYEMAPPATATTIDPVTPFGAIGDLVWLDIVPDGIYDDLIHEPGLSSVTVFLRESGVDLTCGTGDDVLVTQTLTGTNGRYIFEGLLPGTYCVSIDTATLPPGLSLTTPPPIKEVTVPPTGGTFLDIDFGYATDEFHAVIGDYVWSDANDDGIQDSGEIGIGGVTIELLNGPGVDGFYCTPDDDVEDTTTTNTFGTYYFTSVNPGTYMVMITDTASKLAGYAPTDGAQSLFKPVCEPSDPLTVTGGNSYMLMDFGFYNSSLHSVSDRVWMDSNNNGIFDPGEPGIVEVTVTFYEDTNGNGFLDPADEVAGSSITDINGDFHFTGVPDGDYFIKIEDANGKLVGFEPTTPAAVSGELAVTVNGDDPSGINFGYNAPGMIGDTIWKDLNSSGIQDPGEPGIEGVDVELYKDTNGNGLLDPGDALIDSTTTDSNGNYEFQVDEAGRFFVSVPDGQAELSGLTLTTTDDQASSGDQITVFLPDLFTSYLNADFGYNDPGKIGNLVWDDLNGNGIWEAGEPGIQGVTVELYEDTVSDGVFNPAEDLLIDTTTTDANGNYIFQATQLGIHYVSIDETQPTLILKTLTTLDDQAAPGVQLTVNVTDLTINYLDNDFGFEEPLSDLEVTKNSDQGTVQSGDTITYTITVTNTSLTRQTGITVYDPLPVNTAYVAESTEATGPVANSTSATSDDFESDTYTGGSGNWVGGWQEIGEATDPHAGRVQIVTDMGDLSVRIIRSNRGLERTIDLSSCSSAILSFDYRRSSIDAGEGVRVYETHDLGTPIWSVGPGTDGAYLSSGNIAIPYLDTDTEIRFIPFGFDQNNDQFFFDNVQIVCTIAKAVVTKRNQVGYPNLLTDGDPPDLVVALDGFILDQNDSLTVTFQVTVGSLPDIPEITNIVTASSNETQPRKAFVTNPMEYSADLGVTKVVQSLDAPCYVGTCEVTYLITVTNVGTTSVDTITLLDILPDELTYQSQVASVGTYDDVSGVWDLGATTVIPGNSETLTITALVNDLTDIENCANLQTSNPPDENESNNEDCAHITPTLAIISSFRAYEENGEVVVEWSTSSEIDTVGFYLYRLDESTGNYVGINHSLLPGLITSQQGGTYSFIDKGISPEGSFTYILAEVEGKGTENVYGPFTVLLGGDSVTGTLNNAKIQNKKSFKQSIVLKPTNEQMKASSNIVKYFDKDGTLVVTNKNTGTNKQAQVNSRGGQYSNYKRTAREMSDAKKARIEAAKKQRDASNTLEKKRSGEIAKLSIIEKGLYYLDASKIAELLDKPHNKVIDTIKKNTISLQNQGHEVAYLPAEKNAGIYFYGDSIDSIYTKENIYWLGNAGGLQMGHISGKGPEQPVDYGTFTETLSFEEDKSMIPNLTLDPKADHWVWDYIFSFPFSYPEWDTKTYTLKAYGVAHVPETATLVINLFGFTDTVANPDHHVVVSLNGTTLEPTVPDSDKWDGINPHSIAYNIENIEGLLVEGDNTVIVKGVGDTGAPYSGVYIDSFDLTYQRLYRAEENKLIFSSEDNPIVTIHGFTDPNIYVFDISDPLKPKLNRATRIDGSAGNYSASFIPTTPNTPYLAIASSAVVADMDVWADAPSSLASRDNWADYIVIAPEELKDAAHSLANYRQSQGLKPIIVTVEDIMDEFNYGISSPEAIRDFISYAYQNWSKPPQYVVLVGEGTFDYKDNMGYGDNLVPTLLTSTPQGVFASDNLFVELDNDHVPEIPIGRLSVVTPEELHNVINKIITYEGSSSPNSCVIFLADDPDSGGDFPADSDDIASLIPYGMTVEKIYLPEFPTMYDAQLKLLSSLNGTGGVTACNNPVFVNYIGHADLDCIGRASLNDEGLLCTEHLDSLINLDRLPVVTAMTCRVGEYALPGYDSLSEALVLNSDAGAVAAWAPTGLSYNDLAKALDEEFFNAVFLNNKKVLGDAILKALQGYSITGGNTFMMDIYNLQGDPALKMR